ncbi:MAG: hypothetical protein HWE12_00740 [Oceanospirillaceae bacterium]|nr:hypothetical protein [Oceanospirillaceae bacterium]
MRVYVGLLAVLPVLLITGCGGGGSSTVPAAASASAPVASEDQPTPVSLESWSSSISPNAIISAGGLATEASYSAPAPSFAVTETNLIGAVGDAADATLEYNSDGVLREITISTDNGAVVSWNSDDDTFSGAFDGKVILLQSADGSLLGQASNSTATGWEYQGFGAWLSGYGTGSGKTGVMSVGAETLGANIPLSGNATFTGNSLGVYVDSSGAAFGSTGRMAVVMDFSSRSAGFAISNIDTIDLSSLTSAGRKADLDISGNLYYAPSTNSLTGNVSSSGMSGTASAKFYGPSAEEIGGVLGLTGSGGQPESYLGAFGGAR